MGHPGRGILCALWLLIDDRKNLVGLGIKFLAVEADRPSQLRALALEVGFNVICGWDAAASAIDVVEFR